MLFSERHLDYKETNLSYPTFSLPRVGWVCEAPPSPPHPHSGPAGQAVSDGTQAEEGNGRAPMQAQQYTWQPWDANMATPRLSGPGSSLLGTPGAAEGCLILSSP